MGTKHNKSSDLVPDAKRRCCAGSSTIDAGIQANECIKVYMITVWLSSVSFHVYVDISYESSSDGGKGITDLKSSLQVHCLQCSSIAEP